MPGTRSRGAETTEKADAYQEVTDRVLAALDAGTVPWRKPWTSAGRPRSMSSGKPYTGINTWLLGMTGQECGYASPYFGTYRQIEALGGQVRRGEKSTRITLWKSFTPKDAEPDPETGRKPEVVFARMIPVFSACQADGLPEKFFPAPGEERPIASPQRAADVYLAGGNAAALEHDVHGRAYYRPDTDTVHMPPMAEHRSAEDYYSTIFHELAHSTGAESRLARPGITGLQQPGHGFGSHAYGAEELTAQFGAAMLLAETGIDTEKVFDNSTAYIASWRDTIAADKKLIISAASGGQKACDLIMEPSRELQKTMGQAALAVPAQRQAEAAEVEMEMA
jgi:antirestriction protein ArdC